MLKLGILNTRQDTPLQRLWRRGLMSASLLAMPPSPSENDRRRFERLMPDLRLSSGVARTTVRQRFADFNPLVSETLRGIFPPGHPLIAEDWAVSSGITAVEWYELLLQDFPALRFTLSDVVLYLIEARYVPSGEVFILESSGTPIQYIRSPFVIGMVQPQHWIYAVNRALYAKALERWAQIHPQLQLPDWRGLPEQENPLAAPPFELRRLPLLHPDVRRLEGDTFRIREHSVFAPLAQPAEVIRTMNILNLAYFSEERLTEAISAVHRSLRPGGVWIVGRTIDEIEPRRHDVSLFQRTETGWDALRTIGRGSEVAPLAERFQRA